MDYRYYYETIEAPRAGRKGRPGLRAVLAAGLAIEVASAAAQVPAPWSVSATAIACAAAAVAALATRVPLGRALVQGRSAAAGATG